MMDKVDFDFVKGTYNHKLISKVYIELVNEVGIWKSEKTIIQKYFSKNDKIIDFACGAGRTTFGISKLGYNVEGYDLSNVLIDAAREIAAKEGKDINFTIGNMIKTEFKNGSVDGCFISDSGLMQVPGIENRIKTLKEMYRILRNDKYLIFVTPEARDAVGYAKEFWEKQKNLWNHKKHDKRLIDFGDMIFLENSSVENYGHFPTKQEIIECVKQAGFTLCENISRSNICKETPKKKQIKLDELQFWIVQKRVDS